ncbi:MAG TPA: RNA methyltransferase, partial [Anaerolineales bacterium]|nr:RNA methyltransferase [Anaerolineales bacterium]
CSMYNDRMPADLYEIRICNSCGLRYPLADAQARTCGTRCPACLGETRAALGRMLGKERARAASESFQSEEERGKKERGEIAVLLDNLRSAWNAGSILRSADGFGFTHAYMCGITPTPENEAVRKTSLGAEDSVTWSYHKDAVKLVEKLKNAGWRILALEDEDRALAISGASTEGQRAVLIVGNEVTGVDPELLDLCDRVYGIPMQGRKRSFNVAIAFGIAAYALRTS